MYFQCKRYRGSVGPGVVRDFRGAMAGRGDKGLVITTGSFTGDVKREATRDGAPPIDLIDGEGLCELLKKYETGVQTTVRQVEEVAIDPRVLPGRLTDRVLKTGSWLTASKWNLADTRQPRTIQRVLARAILAGDIWCVVQPVRSCGAE